MYMRNLVAILAVGMLSACQQAAPEETNEEAVEETASASVVMPGLYAVGDETTEYGTTRLNEDGTYLDYGDENEVVGSGTWRTDGETLCFDPEGDAELEQEHCWTNEPAGEDGSFRTTLEDGSQSYIVTPIDEEIGQEAEEIVE